MTDYDEDEFDEFEDHDVQNPADAMTDQLIAAVQVLSRTCNDIVEATRETINHKDEWKNLNAAFSALRSEVMERSPCDVDWKKRTEDRIFRMDEFFAHLKFV